MVVVSGGWVKNVAQYPPGSTNENEMVIPTDTMSAKAVLICRPNSHPFQDRTLRLDQPVKVGRSVARAKATQTNAIFDCKVLSRHHALLWYDCGKFYLQDTKSSNGTFINNNRLSTNDSEPQEVSSGDIVQFGVDVVENSNRKVTHGCIIATLKLYLPDGKEAKASPSLIDNNRQGTVPLEDLYELNQIIQEASQREQCLETKLLALQHVVDEARRSADESWQVYVGEERLLSRVAALEAQLSQVGKNIGDERLKEELQKLHEDQTTYQVAAKESLRKLLAERVEALGTAAEHQRARATAEQESMLAREELEKVQKEVQQIVQKLSDERKKWEDEKINLEQKLHALETELEDEKYKAFELQLKVSALEENLKIGDPPQLEQLEKCNLLIKSDDVKNKEEMIENCDNENTDSGIFRSNGVDEPQQNHINKTAANDETKLKVHFEEKSPESDGTMMEWDSQDDLSKASDETEASFVTVIGSDRQTDRNDHEGLIRHDSGNVDAEDDSEGGFNDDNEDEETIDKDRLREVYSKTLKYQFQTAQNEMKKQIENLEQLLTSNKLKITMLEEDLNKEKAINVGKCNEIDNLKESLGDCTQKLKESCNETQQLKDRLGLLTEELKNKDDIIKKYSEKAITEDNMSQTIEQLLTLEEELVKLKEKFAIVNEDKMVLNKELNLVREQYKAECNKSQNTIFFYVAPLVLMLIYLLVSSLFS